MGFGGTAYKVVFLAHILSVIIAIGFFFSAQAFAAFAKQKGGKDGLAIAQANVAIARMTTIPFYGIPIFGILLVILSDGVWTFKQTWITLAFVVFFGIIIMREFIGTPMHRRILVMIQEIVNANEAPSPARVVELKGLQKKAAMVSGIGNLLVLTMLVLMIWKPGF